MPAFESLFSLHPPPTDCERTDASAQFIWYIYCEIYQGFFYYKFQNNVTHIFFCIQEQCLHKNVAKYVLMTKLYTYYHSISQITHSVCILNYFVCAYEVWNKYLSIQLTIDIYSHSTFNQIFLYAHIPWMSMLTTCLKSGSAETTYIFKLFV